MTQNLVKNIIGNVGSSYQVNVAIEIPNITEHILTFSLVDIGYLQCLFKYIGLRHVVGQIFSIREGSELIGTSWENSV